MRRTDRIRLSGCAPTPLAHYLKSLGILRLVAEGADPEAMGCWEGEAFHLISSLDREALLDFFLHRYQPTPIVAPWNGGSGFYPKDNRKAIETIARSSSPRLHAYAEVIADASALCQKLDLKEKPTKEEKTRLQGLCRNEFPDNALPWLDAAFLLTGEGPKYPPLLGTGGNDGRLEFTNNFMQRVMEVMDARGRPTPNAERWLRGSLFGDPVPELSRSAVGQFHPSATGGSNATAGFSADSQVNPWDFINLHPRPW